MSRLFSHAFSDVMSERARQQNAEGWSLAHDDMHDEGELARAAACYALGSRRVEVVDRERRFLCFHAKWFRAVWPWNDIWWNPKDRRRNLVRAAALLIAEIERLDRAAAQDGGGR